MTVSLIWAQSSNGVIGRDGAMPWHIPEDMARFRELTSGSTVVMGRATWESLPARFRPLPGRVNVVVSRNPSYDAPGATVVTSVSAAVASAPDVWVAGGAEIYAATIAAADRLVVTEVDAEVAGDTRAPQVGPAWREVDRSPAAGWHESVSGLRYRWRELQRAESQGA